MTNERLRRQLDAVTPEQLEAVRDSKLTRRTCGKCQECCVLIEVAPLHKPADTRCKFQGTRGCTIYEKRPDCCAGFVCGWLKGYVDRELRPDKVGAVIWPGQLLAMGRPTGIPIICVNVRVGRRIDPRVHAYALSVSMRAPVTITQGEWATIYQQGEAILKWKPREEFFAFDIDPQTGRMVNVRKRAQSEVLADPEKRAAWEKTQRDAVSIHETGEFAGQPETPR